MNELKEAIVTLAQRAKDAEKPNEAMQLAQAALNLAHAYTLLPEVKNEMAT